ncbi:tannase/feruloyl esterase family alpha/beta hydrolase [Salipiger sp. H15]|uniref:Tannase/feruloyl esterase family alpha/beta hydrolase n=1 Tax=Alloyangia sp. H15 TaxID=3029062 RepID=A0AAU8AQ73_9RHOB
MKMALHGQDKVPTGPLGPRRSGWLLAAISVAGVAAWGQGASAQAACTVDLPVLPDVTISQVSAETAPVPHCKVDGVIGGKIHFELLLPDDWNGKFVMGGGGGFVGSVLNSALLFGALQSGYASVGTDTGHQGHPLDASWALDDLEALVNFGHLAVHRTAVTAKALINAYYQRQISRSYFTGCSRGGGQAIMSASRYPEDFDSIVAGAPAIDWTGMGALATQVNRAMYPDPDNLSRAVVGPEAEALLERSYMAACDGLDGLEDGILSDPRQCHFDVASLQCDAGATNECLSPEEVAAIRAVYDAPRDSAGIQLNYGYSFGGETSPRGSSRWLTGGLDDFTEEFQEGIGSGGFKPPISPSAMFSFGNGIMRDFVYHDEDWSYLDYDPDSYAKDSKVAAATLNAKTPDLSAFRARGGKLLIYSGWSDSAIPPLGTIGYYEDVLAHDPSAAADVRLFMLPGVEHCSGGPGPSYVNFLTEIDTWTETGQAPDAVIALWLDAQHQPDGGRPVCAYPQVVRYDGSGDPRDPASFSCGSAN